MSFPFFIAITRRAFKKCSERRKSRARFYLSPRFYLSHISVKKIIENCNSVHAEPQNIGKVVSFWPNFDTNFTDIKLHILKRVGLSTFKEIL